MKSHGLVQAEFRSISWLEPYPIEQYKPDPFEPFSIELTVLIGPKGLQGEEIFYVDVSNVLFLEQELRHSGPHAISSTILVDEFSVEAIERILREFCETCRGRTWHDVALMLTRLGRWEYEGMETP